MHAVAFPWLIKPLSGQPQLDPGTDKDTKNDTKPWTQNPFWFPKPTPPRPPPTPPNYNTTRVPEWTVSLFGFYYASRRSDRAFLDERSQSPSVMERNLLWWEWAVMNDGWERERRERGRGRASGRDEQQEIKLIAKCWRRARKRSHKAKRRERTQIQMSFIGFQGQWIVSILHFFLSVTVSHCFPPPPALFVSSVSSSLSDFIGSY